MNGVHIKSTDCLLNNEHLESVGGILVTSRVNTKATLSQMHYRRPVDAVVG